ncbi:hypothetical protein P152DRAFT_497211 [Eremomyces bilateralis CBS 781.70]|uniref:Uncharacterized protein n=1 Tax=Eremomyces bilateralis CBS 781.70 TaxID=1392243 RepID=A0A6G1FSP5_9PEZI|nr:uncharacterized protein P152DRAFT_497211 [Eremomyces bilateralis CBS 781.70]KAF1808807.1 hypothetical protein P152DRAFT_497211 [Eremomyces bilateralis CBS 781.70]
MFPSRLRTKARFRDLYSFPILPSLALLTPAHTHPDRLLRLQETAAYLPTPSGRNSKRYGKKVKQCAVMLCSSLVQSLVFYP